MSYFHSFYDDPLPVEQQWEYYRKNDPTDSDMSELGTLGWEAYAVVPDTDLGYGSGYCVTVFFKRKKGGTK